MINDAANKGMIEIKDDPRVRHYYLRYISFSFLCSP